MGFYSVFFALQPSQVAQYCCSFCTVICTTFAAPKIKASQENIKALCTEVPYCQIQKGTAQELLFDVQSVENSLVEIGIGMMLHGATVK